MIIVLIFLGMIQAEVLDFKVSSLKKHYFDYKNVCSELELKHLLIVTPKNTKYLDCMGTDVDVSLFCAKKFAKSNAYLRGYINTKMEEVVCEEGKSALLKIGCDKQHKYLCKNPKSSCLRLKNIYASSLELSHTSFQEKDVDNILNCYFKDKTKEDSSHVLSKHLTTEVKSWEKELKEDKIFDETTL